MQEQEPPPPSPPLSIHSHEAPACPPFPAAPLAFSSSDAAVTDDLQGLSKPGPRRPIIRVSLAVGRDALPPFGYSSWNASIHWSIQPPRDNGGTAPKIEIVQFNEPLGILSNFLPKTAHGLKIPYWPAYEVFLTSELGMTGAACSSHREHCATAGGCMSQLSLAKVLVLSCKHLLRGTVSRQATLPLAGSVSHHQELAARLSLGRRSCMTSCCILSILQGRLRQPSGSVRNGGAQPLSGPLLRNNLEPRYSVCQVAL